MANPSSNKVAIDNVRVFDGHKLQPPSTVVIVGDVIGRLDDVDEATQHIDAAGGVLLPGFIENHAHASSVEHIEIFTSYGVTTVFNMAAWRPTMTNELQGHDGLADVRRTTVPAAAPGSRHGDMGIKFGLGEDLLVRNPEEARPWVQRQVKEWDPEYVKIVAETPGLDQPTLDALVDESHRLGKKVVCHAATLEAQQQALAARADQIHHVPCDIAVDAAMAAKARGERADLVVVPTLFTMKAVAKILPGRSYAASQASVKAWYEAGVPVLVGTDASMALKTIGFGRTLHEELELLVEAGVPALDVLRGATCLAAEKWGLADRGVIAPGKRADLVLVQGDPIDDVKVTRNLQRVWVAGREYEKPLGTFGSLGANELAVRL